MIDQANSLTETKPMYPLAVHHANVSQPRVVGRFDPYKLKPDGNWFIGGAEKRGQRVKIDICGGISPALPRLQGRALAPTKPLIVGITYYFVIVSQTYWHRCPAAMLAVRGSIRMQRLQHLLQEQEQHKVIFVTAPENAPEAAVLRSGHL